MTTRKRETFTVAETVINWLEASATTDTGKEGEDVANCPNSASAGTSQARVDRQSSRRVANDVDESNQIFVAQVVGTSSAVGAGPSQSAAHQLGVCQPKTRAYMWF